MQVLVEKIGAEEVEAFWHDDPVLVALATGSGAAGLARRPAPRRCCRDRSADRHPRPRRLRGAGRPGGGARPRAAGGRPAALPGRRLRAGGRALQRHDLHRLRRAAGGDGRGGDRPPGAVAQPADVLPPHPGGARGGVLPARQRPHGGGRWPSTPSGCWAPRRCRCRTSTPRSPSWTARCASSGSSGPTSARSWAAGRWTIRRFDPFYEALVDLDVPLFVHPCPDGIDRPVRDERPRAVGPRPAAGVRLRRDAGGGRAGLRRRLRAPSRPGRVHLPRRRRGAVPVRAPGGGRDQAALVPGAPARTRRRSPRSCSASGTTATSTTSARCTCWPRCAAPSGWSSARTSAAGTRAARWTWATSTHRSGRTRRACCAWADS